MMGPRLDSSPRFFEILQEFPKAENLKLSPKFLGSRCLGRGDLKCNMMKRMNNENT